MLQSKDKVIQLLKDHFNGLGIDIKLNNNKLVIRDSLINMTIIIHIIIAILATEFVSSVRENIYFFPALFLYSIIAYIIFWVDYKSINILEFDLQNKNMHVKNRSFIRRLVYKYFIPQASRYYFEEIRAVKIIDNDAMNFLLIKHLVNANLRNGQNIGLISFSDKMNSILFSKFITALIHE
jgi:hypothetical protein